MRHDPPEVQGSARGEPDAAEPAGRFRRALVIANPISGRGRAARTARVLADGLARMEIEAEVYLTEKRGDAPARLRQLAAGTDLVCAVGGDGTLREVLEGLPDPTVPVALLPSGTANVVAHELGLPRDLEGSLAVVRAGRTRWIDVARVNERLSVFVASAGIDALAVQEVERRRSGPITRWTYAAAVLRVLWGYRPPRLTVELDGEPVEGEYGLVLASNTAGYGSILELSPEVRIDDGLWEVYLFPTARLHELAAAFVRGLVGYLAGGAVVVRRARTIRISSEEPEAATPFQVDGDLGGSLPLKIEVLAARHRILAP